MVFPHLLHHFVKKGGSQGLYGWEGGGCSKDVVILNLQLIPPPLPSPIPTHHFLQPGLFHTRVNHSYSICSSSHSLGRLSISSNHEMWREGGKERRTKTRKARRKRCKNLLLKPFQKARRTYACNSGDTEKQQGYRGVGRFQKIEPLKNTIAEEQLENEAVKYTSRSKQSLSLKPAEASHVCLASSLPEEKPEETEAEDGSAWPAGCTEATHLSPY